MALPRKGKLWRTVREEAVIAMVHVWTGISSSIALTLLALGVETLLHILRLKISHVAMIGKLQDNALCNQGVFQTRQHQGLQANGMEFLPHGVSDYQEAEGWQSLPLIIKS